MPDAPAPLIPGATVGGRFRLESLVGSGGMGFVWRATSLETGEPVALKFLKPTDARDESAKRRMRREAKAAMSVQHPNVVQIHDFISGDDGQPIIVMQFLVGETLQARLAKDAPLDVTTFADILLPVVSAVGTAHAIGVVHRDLKPENIWLVTADGKQSPRVLDFGIAKMVGPSATDSSGGGTLTTTGGVLGTPRYMAPEQVFGDKDIDHRADVWSMGVIAYECLSGRRPIQGDNVWQVLRAITTGDIVPLDEAALGVPPAIAKIVMRMLSVDRNKRPDDLVELFETLQAFSKADAPSFPHTPATHTEGHFAKTIKHRERRVVFFAATVAVLLGVAGIAARSGGAPVAAPMEDGAAANVVTASSSTMTTAASAPPAVVAVPEAGALEPRVPAVRRPAAAATVSAPVPPPTLDPFHGLAVDAPF